MEREIFGYMAIAAVPLQYFTAVPHKRLGVFSLLESQNHSCLSHPLEVISTMSKTIQFSPAIPWPVPFDIQKRIEELRGYLDPKNPQYERGQQHVNIRAAIQLYEDGKSDGSQEVYIHSGRKGCH
jgi:hypothetical protein